MNTLRSLAVLIAGTGLLAAADAAPAPAPAPKPELKAQTQCPMMDMKIDKALFVDQDGKRLYVCCRGCIEPVKKDFAGAVTKLAAKGEKPEDLPVEKKPEAAPAK